MPQLRLALDPLLSTATVYLASGDNLFKIHLPFTAFCLREHLLFTKTGLRFLF